MNNNTQHTWLDLARNAIARITGAKRVVAKDPLAPFNKISTEEEFWETIFSDTGLALYSATRVELEGFNRNIEQCHDDIASAFDPNTNVLMIAYSASIALLVLLNNTSTANGEDVFSQEYIEMMTLLEEDFESSLNEQNVTSIYNIIGNSIKGYSAGVALSALYLMIIDSMMCYFEEAKKI